MSRQSLSAWLSLHTERFSSMYSASLVCRACTTTTTILLIHSLVVQAAGIIFEATRLVMVQRLLTSADFKMDPMVSLYYYAPACAVINGVITLVVEVPKMSMLDIYGLGFTTLLANAFIAFLLNVAVVLLVSDMKSVVDCRANLPSDRENICCSLDVVGSTKGHSSRHGVNRNLRRPSHANTVLWLLYRPRWTGILQAWRRESSTSEHADQTGCWQLSSRPSGPDQSDYIRDHADGYGLDCVVLVFKRAVRGLSTTI